MVIIIFYKEGHWFAMTNAKPPNIQIKPKYSRKLVFKQKITNGEEYSQRNKIVA